MKKLMIIILLFCCSCSSTVVVNGTPIKHKSKYFKKKEVNILTAVAVGCYSVFKIVVP